jgi:hypothetical protein
MRPHDFGTCYSAFWAALCLVVLGGNASGQGTANHQYAMKAVQLLRADEAGTEALSNVYLAISTARETGDAVVLSAIRDSMAAIIVSHPNRYTRGKAIGVLRTMMAWHQPLPVERYLQLHRQVEDGANRSFLLSALSRHPDRAGAASALGRVVRRGDMSEFDQLVALNYLEETDTDAARRELRLLLADSASLAPEVRRQVKRIVRDGL